MAANVKVDFDPVPPSLVVKEIIGQGSHCAVYSGELDSNLVVVKKIREDLLNFVDFHKFKEDCDRMKNVRHPNVIEFVGVYKEKRTPILVMELMQEDLDTYLKRNRGQLPAERSSAICCSVCDGGFCRVVVYWRKMVLQYCCAVLDGCWLINKTKLCCFHGKKKKKEP